MINLLIVDDEPLVQIGISSIIKNQSKIEINICGTASNGLEALEKIRLLSPEIVICDIKMPVMDGLELAQKCKLLYGRLPVFIMLTSYEEFEFAKKAIQCQVCEYLIKIDLTPDILISALQKALSYAEEYTGHNGTENIKSYHDKFFIQLLNNLLEKPAIMQEAASLSLNLDYSHFAVAYGTMETSINHQSADISNASFSSTINMLPEILKKYANVYLVSTDVNHFAIIFCFTSAQYAAIKSIINDALCDCIELIRNYFSISLFIGTGTVTDSIESLYISFAEAKEANKYVKPDSMKTYKALLEERKEFERNKLIFDIQHYIDSHLTDKLSLNSIAANFGISCGYLSSMFKKVIGISLIDYINRQKVEFSKILLKEQRMKIYEIADYLSFENTYYYSKVFRRYIGCSPSEYIASLINQDY